MVDKFDGAGGRDRAWVLQGCLISRCKSIGVLLQRLQYFDGGVATEDAIATDVTGDGKIDIIAGGRATHNLKLYVQQ